MRIFFITVAVASFLAPILAQKEAQKQDGKTPFMVSFTDLKWVELPERKGMQFALLSGNPKTGPYTQIRKVPAGTDNPLHSHSSEIKNVIISGVWYTGADTGAARDFGPGSVVMMPADWGARERLPPRQRLHVLPGGHRQIRLQAGCRQGFQRQTQQVIRLTNRRSQRPHCGIHSACLPPHPGFHPGARLL